MSQSSGGNDSAPGRNVEFKARVDNIASLQAMLSRHVVLPPFEIAQDDTFFSTKCGRLKLRQFSVSSGELIAYERNDQAGARISEYVRVPTDSPVLLREALSRSLGVIGRVKKRRLVYLIDIHSWSWNPEIRTVSKHESIDGQELTRVHLDQVDRLGDFLELEVVLGPLVSEQSGRAFAQDFLKGLGISESCLVGQAYMDLMPSSHNI